MNVPVYAQITNQVFIPVIRRPYLALANKACNASLVGLADASNRVPSACGGLPRGPNIATAAASKHCFSAGKTRGLELADYI